MERTIYHGAWATLFLTVLPFFAFFALGILWALFISIISLVVGVYSLYVIHKHKKYFKGALIIYPCILVSLLCAVVFGSILFVLFSNHDPSPRPIVTDEDALMHALWRAHLTESDVVSFVVDRPSVDLYKAQLTEEEFNSVEVFVVDWSKVEDGSNCSVTFTSGGSLLVPIDCS